MWRPSSLAAATGHRAILFSLVERRQILLVCVRALAVTHQRARHAVMRRRGSWGSAGYAVLFPVPGRRHVAIPTVPGSRLLGLMSRATHLTTHVAIVVHHRIAVCG